MKQRIVVTAAVIERDGAFLLTRRLDGTHLAGHWEFPGGKLHAGETLEECLAREIREELDADIEVGPEILATVHDYPERSVELRFFRLRAQVGPDADDGTGDAMGGARDLPSVQLPPADDELVRLLTADAIRARGSGLGLGARAGARGWTGRSSSRVDPESRFASAHEGSSVTVAPDGRRRRTTTAVPGSTKSRCT